MGEKGVEVVDRIVVDCEGVNADRSCTFGVVKLPASKASAAGMPLTCGMEELCRGSRACFASERQMEGEF